MSLIPGAANIQKNGKKIEKWAEQFSLEVNNIVNRNSGVAKFQSLVDQASYHTISIQGNELLNNISTGIDEKLKDVVRTMISNKLLLESEFLQNDQSFRTVDCCASRDKLRYDARFKNNVDTNSSCVIAPGGNTYLTSSLEDNYKRNVLTSSAIKWQYFGSRNGFYHQYPSSEHLCSKEEKFDPRLR